jgi:hypothetical protein
MVARKHADDPVQAVADEITEGLDLSQERQQRIAQGIAAITKTFAPDMRRFNGIYIQAACRRNGPWTSRQGTGRQAWREYVNNLIDLFEYGEKGRTPSQPPGY